MDLIEYFERQERRCERELKYAEAAGFQLFEKTAEGEKDVTAEHIRQLHEARDDYRQMIEDLKSRAASRDLEKT